MALQSKRPPIIPQSTYFSPSTTSPSPSPSPSPPSSSSPRTYEVLPPPAVPLTNKLLIDANLYDVDTSYTTSSRTSQSAPTTATEMQHDSGTYTPTRTRPRAGHRELTPWCGMGGLKGQQWGIWNPSAMVAMRDTHSSEEEMEDHSGSEGEVPVLSPETSSLGDFTPGPVTPSGINKRRLFDGDEDDAESNRKRRIIKLPKRRKFIGGVQNTGPHEMGLQDTGFPSYRFGEEVEMSGI